MFDFLLDILQINIDYKSILAYAAIYLVSLWLLFCLWVFFDAKKRYTNMAVPIALFLAVLILNFPALIFYLIIRPEDDEDMFFYGGEQNSSNGGVNVPLVNFVGESGNIELSFGLNISKIALNNPSLKINVEVDETNPNLKKVAVKSENLTSEGSKQVNASNEKVKETFSNLKSKFGGNAKNLISSVKSYSSNLSEKEKELTKPEAAQDSEKKAKK